MSRSIRKTKIFGNVGSLCHASEKKDKKLFHKMYRSLEREIVRKIEQGAVDSENVVFFNEEETMDVWSMDKDGKHYWEDVEEKDMRK